MEALNSLNNVLRTYEQDGFRVSVEFPQQELLKLFAWVAATFLFVGIALFLLKGIFNDK